MKWIETITPKQAAEELGVPYHGWMREMDRAWISEDQKYSVMSRLLRTEWGKVEHVTITAAEGVGQSDGSGDIPWAVKMEIKNDLFGEKRVAVEVFPTQDRLVDVCDCYHLWVFEKGFQLPFGIHPRDKKTVTVNRGSTRVRAIDGAGREHSIKELLEENGAADVPKQAYEQAIAGYPYRVAGIEMQIGAYVEQLDPLWKASLVDDDHWHYDVFSCKSGEKQVGSISSDYAQTGSFDLNDKATWSWHYIRKLGKLGAEAMMYEKFNGSGSTYVRAAFRSPSSAGVYAPWRGGSLNVGAPCGLPCAYGNTGPGTAYWHGVPRLAGSGKKRG